jgi:hypothetical protein
MNRITDVSRSKCITCGRPYKTGEALYGLMSKFEEEDGVKFLTEFEHASCHVPIEEAIAHLREELSRHRA